MTNDPILTALIDLSVRLGRDPLLVQAATGNTSLKVDGVLWIKASGTWLAHADQPDSLAPVDLGRVRDCIRQKKDFSYEYTSATGKTLTASIETAMHAVLPHRVVVHVHSVNTIAWAVRRDGPAQLMALLAGLDWQWIPYVPSGLPLAFAIQKACSGFPRTNIFVLANHGLVVCGDDCDSTEALLSLIERRIAVHPRPAREPDCLLLEEAAAGSEWRPADDARVHTLATDPIAQAILTRGILYPCHAIFLGPSAPLLPVSMSPREFLAGYEHRYGVRPRFLLVEGAGVIVHASMTQAEGAMLGGLAGIVQRLDGRAPIRYLTGKELAAALTGNAYRYRGLVESGGSRFPDVAEEVFRRSEVRAG